MKDFVRLLHTLENALDDIDRIRALQGYWPAVNESDRLWSLWLLLPRRFGKGASSQELGVWAMEQAGLPQWLFEEAKGSASDLAEACALVIGEESPQNPQSLSHWIDLLMYLSTKPLDRRDQVIAAWLQMNSVERYWFNRLLLGTFRFKIKPLVLVEALAHFIERPATVLWHRLWSDWTPKSTNWAELLLCNHFLDDLVKPYSFFDLSDWKSIYFEWDKTNCRIEWHREGIKIQVIVRQGKGFVWTEKGEWLTGALPEIKSLTTCFSEDLVFVGTLMGFKDGQFLPLQLLEERLSKKETKRSREKCPLLFIANDLLEYKGENICEQNLEQRLDLLESLCKQKKLPMWFTLAESLVWENKKDLSGILNQASEYAANGFVLRRLSAPYENTDYYWKKPPMTIWATLLYVTRDERNPDRFKEFSFAVLKGTEELVPIAKCAWDLPAEDHQELKLFVQQNTIERFGPVISIRADLIFSLSFAGLRVSARRKSGMELLSPKVLTWEKDGSKETLSTLRDLQEMLVL